MRDATPKVIPIKDLAASLSQRLGVTLRVNAVAGEYNGWARGRTILVVDEIPQAQMLALLQRLDACVPREVPHG